MKKYIYLLRGLPGSGKTTLAQTLSENGSYPVFAIDDYFTNPETGEYIFDYKQNYLAYQQCEQKTQLAMQKGMSKIFVDNTFTIEEELKPYMKLAQEYGYILFVITVENRHGGTNTHQVTTEQLAKMAAKYKVVLM